MIVYTVNSIFLTGFSASQKSQGPNNRRDWKKQFLFISRFIYDSHYKFERWWKCNTF